MGVLGSCHDVEKSQGVRDLRCKPVRLMVSMVILEVFVRGCQLSGLRFGYSFGSFLAPAVVTPSNVWKVVNSITR